jgi:hypothetical protein
MPIKPSNDWEKANRPPRPTPRSKIVTLKTNLNIRKTIAGEFVPAIPLDTVVGAVLIVLAPFGIWKLVELVTRHLQ